MIISKINIQFKWFMYQKPSSQFSQCSSCILTFASPMMPSISQIIELASLYNQLFTPMIFHGSQKEYTVQISQLVPKLAKLPNLHRISMNPFNLYHKMNCLDKIFQLKAQNQGMWMVLRKQISLIK